MTRKLSDGQANVVSVDFKREGQPSSQVSSPLSCQKRVLFESWLVHGTVSVLFDARLRGVRVPEEFAESAELRLNFCHQFHIPDFAFSDEGVSATLAFVQGEYFCMVPWEAVYGFQSEAMGKGIMWPESVPADVDFDDVVGDPAAIDAHDDDCEAVPNNIVSLDFHR